MGLIKWFLLWLRVDFWSRTDKYLGSSQSYHHLQIAQTVNNHFCEHYAEGILHWFCLRTVCIHWIFWRVRTFCSNLQDPLRTTWRKLNNWKRISIDWKNNLSNSRSLCKRSFVIKVITWEQVWRIFSFKCTKTWKNNTIKEKVEKDKGAIQGSGVPGAVLEDIARFVHILLGIANKIRGELAGQLTLKEVRKSKKLSKRCPITDNLILMRFLANLTSNLIIIWLTQL